MDIPWQAPNESIVTERLTFIVTSLPMKKNDRKVKDNINTDFIVLKVLTEGHAEYHKLLISEDEQKNGSNITSTLNQTLVTPRAILRFMISHYYSIMLCSLKPHSK
ncbi:MAG: hypothetical protein NVSMB24_34240 [Mucilaginibacter sp.]